MPPSIDPIQNMFGTGASLFGRVFVAFSAGWLGILLSRICASTTRWEDVYQLHEVISDVLEIGPVEVLFFAFWPLIAIYFLMVLPFYGILLVPLLILALYKIIMTDDPILFWGVLIIALLLPGFSFVFGNLWSLVPFTMLASGVGAALWWSLNLEHGEWIDTVQGWVSRK